MFFMGQENLELKMEIEKRMARKGSYSKRISRIDPLSPEDESEEVKQILEEVRRETKRPVLATTWHVWAHIPMFLKGKWLCLKAAMFEGKLSRRLKDMISIVIDKEFGCQS
jgi:hypothetical protein